MFNGIRKSLFLLSLKPILFLLKRAVKPERETKMLNEKIAGLLKSREEADVKCDEARKVLASAGKVRSGIQTKIAKAFAEGFTGSDEEILFMLDWENSSDEMYAFRSKFLIERKLGEVGYNTSSRQYGVGVNLYNDEADLRVAAAALKDLFRAIKPVKCDGWAGKGTEYVLVHLNISSVVEYEKFSDNVYLVKEGELYQVTTIERRRNTVIADWSEDIAEVMIKAKAYLEENYGYGEDSDED